jgi:hypothetical protein
MCQVRLTTEAQREIGNDVELALEHNGPVVRFVPDGKKVLAEAQRARKVGDGN